MKDPYRPPGADFDYQPQVPPALARPTLVTVLGIFSIVLGSLQLVCLPLEVLGAFVQPGQMANDPVIQVTMNPSYRRVVEVMGVLGTFVSAVEIIAGIGLLQLRSWGRILSLSYAAYAMLHMIAGIIASAIYIVKPLMKIVQDNVNPESTGRAVGGIIGGTIGYLLGGIFPFLLLILLTRPRIVAAFRRNEAYDHFGPEPANYS